MSADEPQADPPPPSAALAELLTWAAEARARYEAMPAEDRRQMEAFWQSVNEAYN